MATIVYPFFITYLLGIATPLFTLRILTQKHDTDDGMGCLLGGILICIFALIVITAILWIISLW
jgi:hypothetical protein